MRATRGFTVIELLIAITIILVLISAAGIQITNARKTGRDARRLGDVLLIAKAIDQSVTLSRGIYPKNVANAGVNNNLTMCASEMVRITNGNVSNPYNLDLTLFTQNKIPVDPLPATTNPTNSGCADFTKGYTYHTLYTGAQTINYATRQNVAYSLEVGLERDKIEDENLFRRPSELSDPAGSNFPASEDTLQGRQRFLLNGKFCGANVALRCY